MADVTKEQVVDFLSKMSVMDMAALKTELEDKWGVKAAVAVAGGGAAPAAGGGAAAPVAEQTEFTVILADAGANKIGVIRPFARSPTSASRRPRTWSTARRRRSRKASRRLTQRRSRRSSPRREPRSTSSNSSLLRSSELENFVSGIPARGLRPSAFVQQQEGV